MMSGFGWSGQQVCPLLRVWRNFLGVFCIATLFTTACSRQVEPPAAIVIAHDVSPQPVRIGPAIVSLTLADNDAKPVTGAHITLEADMTHAGMAPVFAEAKEIEPGRYQSQVSFQMAGDWVILLHVTMSSGQKLERRFDVSGVKPN
jgi:hypothetical protein